jgi:hypothetical protein
MPAVTRQRQRKRSEEPVKLVLEPRPLAENLVAPLPVRPVPVVVTGQTWNTTADATCAVCVVGMFVIGGVLIVGAWFVLLVGLGSWSDGSLAWLDWVARDLV